MNCRFCKTKIETLFLDLGHSPVSNDFITQNDLQKPEVYYPLQVYVCERCKLVQTKDFKASDELFRADYPYFSSVSKSWVEHCRAYAEMMVNRFGLRPGDYIVEIASNDGYLLQFFHEKGFDVCGIEPTRGTAEAAIAKGIPTVVDFFTKAFARQTFDQKKANLIIGNNVLAHVPDINDFLDGLKLALAPTGIMTFEFPHFLQLYRQNQFDTIYHEHYSYFSLLTIKAIFEYHAFHVFDTEELPTHGGSLRIFVQHQPGSRPESKQVKRILAMEEASGLSDISTYQNFARKAWRVKWQFLSFLLEARTQGRQVAAYGAAAKGNTLLNYCGVKPDLIAFCCDANPQKQHKFLPGSHIPVLPPEKVNEAKPDYVIILPWNLKDEITRELEAVRTWGGKFVTPIPELTIF